MQQIKIKDFLNNIKKYIIPSKNPYIIGIAGGSGSGKSFVAERIAKEFNAIIIKMDDYYKPFGNKFDEKKTNVDIPDALDLELLKQHIIQLKQQKSIKKPIYDYKTHLRESYENIFAQKVMIIDGLFALSNIFSDLLDLKIFIDSDEEIRLKRRIQRDIKQRARTKQQVITQWNTTVEPMFKEFILPQKQSADLIINSNENIL